VSFAVAALLLGAFVSIERRSAEPLVRLSIFRSGSLRRANLGAVAVFGAYVGFQFVATLYMQGLRGWSALGMAFAFLPAGLIVAFGAPRVGALADRFGTQRVILVGAVAVVTLVAALGLAVALSGVGRLRRSPVGVTAARESPASS
jgi:nitrate/nitrite transporter NarK